MASSEGRSSEPPSVVFDEELLFREITNDQLFKIVWLWQVTSFGTRFELNVAKSAYVAIMIK